MGVSDSRTWMKANRGIMQLSMRNGGDGEQMREVVGGGG